MNELTQKEYRRLKSNLTRAVNSGDPLKLVEGIRGCDTQGTDGGH